MKDKTKKTVIVAIGTLVCVALIVGIASRFNVPATISPDLDNTEQTEDDTVVDVTTNTLTISLDTGDDNSQDDTKPGAGADSSGTEQTIQADPVKAEAPENPTPIEDDHDSEDVPEAERNTETPPSYSQEQTTVTTPSEPQGGEGYLPGFGYIESSGEGTVIYDDSIYENGNKVGIMD